MAVARASPPDTCPHSLKVLFEARMTEPFPQRFEITWKTRLAWD